MLEWRLRAFRHFMKLVDERQTPKWANLTIPEIDFQAFSYYSAPKPKLELESLDQVDAEILKTYEKLGIPLEEQKRMDRLFTDDLKARIGEVTTEQMIGLRYASDEELADLVRRVLDENISDRKTIKQDVKNWRADNERI